MLSGELGDLLDWSVDALEQSSCKELAASGLVERMRAELGGSHTVVTYPPLDALAPIESNEVLNSVGPVKGLNLYAHIAFCEFLCPFCHYDTEHAKIGTEENDRTRAYLRALEIEVQAWKSRLDGSTLSSLYIGGGTPTAVSQESLISLLAVIEEIPREQDFVACIETSPLTLVASDGKSKMKSLVAAGIGRFSIGIQTFNSTLLRRSRGHSQEIVIKALDILQGFDNVNIDLMQDLPGQTSSHIIDDLRYIEQYQPAQVTWYIFRVRPEASWYSRYRRDALELTNPVESIRKSLIIREGMARLGYIAMPGGRFIREERFRDRFKDIRAGLESTLLGVGVSAYSHGWGFIFRNAFSRWGINGISSYIDRIEAKASAVEMALYIDDVERAASTLVAGIRTGVRMPVPTQSNLSYIEFASERIAKLEAAGLVEQDQQGLYSLTVLGTIFEEELCAQFYSPAVQSRLKEFNDKSPYSTTVFPDSRTVTSNVVQILH